MQTKKNKQITALKNYTKEEGQKAVEESKRQTEELQHTEDKYKIELNALDDDIRNRD